MTTRGHLPPLALVIDDDHLMGQLCARTLERLGLQVVCCDTSVKAANLMQLHEPPHRVDSGRRGVGYARHKAPGCQYQSGK